MPFLSYNSFSALMKEAEISMVSDISVWMVHC